MTDDRSVYFRRRGREARELAARAVDDRVRAVHLEMARRYDEYAGVARPGDGDDED